MLIKKSDVVKVFVLSLAVGVISFIGSGKGVMKYTTNVAHADVPPVGADGGCGDGDCAGGGDCGDSSGSGGDDL